MHRKSIETNIFVTGAKGVKIANVLQPLCSYGSSRNIYLDLDLLDLIPCGVSMGFGDLLGPGLDGYLISDSLARMNDFPSLSAMGAAYLTWLLYWWFCFLSLDT